MSILEMKNIVFGYDEGGTILHDVSLRIDEPKFLCIVGPNGVGKSTLIRCINGILKPSSGSVTIFDKPVEEYDLKELAKCVSYVPVMNVDFNVMTVLDTVLIGRYARQKWKTSVEDIEVAHKALGAMEIEHLHMRNFDELSAGQHQKVSLARGLVQEAPILILDEPTSNLDVRHQMYVSKFLKILVRKTKMTVIMVSHDLNLSAKFADEIVVMEPPGKVYGIGKPSDVITKDMLRKVYKVDADIYDDDGCPHVILQDVLFDGTED